MSKPAPGSPDDGADPDGTRPDDFSTTIALVEAAQAGDRTSLEKLFERYLPRVRRIVAMRTGRRLRQSEDVEDIVQETLLEVLQGIDRFESRSEGSFRNWLARCVEHRIIDAARRQASKKRGGGAERRFGDFASDDLHASIFAGREPAPSAILRGRELGERLEEAILALPEHHREIIILRALCDMSYAEIARTMGFAEETNARMAFSRALEKLRKAIGD
jgi:RNA polymerase sigma-70 factor (subfamily 1)